MRPRLVETGAERAGRTCPARSSKRPQARSGESSTIRRCQTVRSVTERTTRGEEALQRRRRGSGGSMQTQLRLSRLLGYR